jgi:hypothetical protein
MPRARSKSSTDTRITRRIRHSQRGTVFTPAVFAKLGTRAAIDKALQRLVASGEIRRLSRGLYDKPRHDAILGTLWPNVEAVVKAIIGKDRIRIQPAGVYAANLLGLSEQVPAKIVYLTDGTSRSIKAGPMRIVLKHTSPRDMATSKRASGTVIQALKSLGPQHITRERLEHLRKTIPLSKRQELLDDLHLAPSWMRPMLQDLTRNALPDEATNGPKRRVK